MPNKPLGRKKTFNEYIYSLGQEVAPSFCLQFLVKGKGKIEAKELEQAISRLANILPQLRIQSRGKYWSFEGELPELIVHNELAPEDLNHEIYRKTLPNLKGSLMEFQLFDERELLFRIHHSVVDAKGAQIILQALFALLRKEALEIYTGFDSDEALREQLDADGEIARASYLFQWPGFFLSDNPIDYQTQLIDIPLKIEAPLAKVAVWYAQKFGDGSRIMIPVDLRRHEEAKQAASNLSLPIYLQVEPQQSWQEVQAMLLQALHEKQELRIDRWEKLASASPGFLLKSLMKMGIRKARKLKSFPMSAILSDNGSIDLSDYQTANFQASHLISLPVFIPLAPFCTNVILQKERSLICCSFPAHLDGEKIKEEIREHLTFDLKEEKREETYGELNGGDFEELKKLWIDILACPPEIIHADEKFHNLGGDSLKLLSMLSELADDFQLEPQSSFVSQALNTGGDLNIRELIQIMEPFRSSK
ncbi:MAG: acyl carrier protein [Bacteroidia bacterium]|nr:acyl carrier protein [Bacteroidia bacterium]